MAWTIQNLIDDVESDKKSVLICAAIPLLFGLLCDQFYTSILAYCSAYGFFIYYRALHCVRLKLTEIDEYDSDIAHEMLKVDFWQKHKWTFNIAKGIKYAVPLAYFLERWVN